MNADPKCQISTEFDGDPCPNPGHCEVTVRSKNRKLDTVNLCDGHVSYIAWKCDGCDEWFGNEIKSFPVPDNAKMCSDCAKVYT
jgi:hypothetical protein